MVKYAYLPPFVSSVSEFQMGVKSKQVATEILTRKFLESFKHQSRAAWLF
jgi:hypothetical protein